MTIAQDLSFLTAAQDSFDAYLQSEPLYYPLGGDMQLGIGPLRETLWRLNTHAVAERLSATQLASLRALQVDFAAKRHRLAALYDGKARREFKSRLDAWNWYLDDPTGGPRGYVAQTHARFRLGLMAADVEMPSNLKLRLDMSDLRLRETFVSGAFVWEPELLGAVDKHAHWYLFGHLK